MGFLTLFKPKKPTPLVTQLADASGQHAIVSGRDVSPFEKFQVKSLVAGGMVVDGNITSPFGAAIDGVVNGNVTVEADAAALLIRAGAKITGTVKASVIILRGEVEGSIEGDFVRLYAGSRMTGPIRANRLMVDVGAVIVNEAMGVALPVAFQPMPRPVAPPVAPMKPTPVPDAPPVVDTADSQDDPVPSFARGAAGGLRAEDFVSVLQARVGAR